MFSNSIFFSSFILFLDSASLAPFMSTLSAPPPLSVSRQEGAHLTWSVCEKPGNIFLSVVTNPSPPNIHSSSHH